MVSLSLTNDETIFDGQVSVTWQSADGSTERSLSAIAGPVKSTDVTGTEGGLRLVSRVWNVCSASLQPGDLPAPGDRMIDEAGLEWTIAETSWVSLSTRWRLECRRLDWSAARVQYIRLDRPTITHDSSGGAVRTWLPVEFNRPAVIQPRSMPKQDESWTRTRSQWVDVFVHETVVFQRDDRIVTESNDVITIRDVSISSRVGEPTVVHGEMAPWPAP
jgi:hypothetical protein